MGSMGLCWVYWTWLNEFFHSHSSPMMEWMITAEPFENNLLPPLCIFSFEVRTNFLPKLVHSVKLSIFHHLGKEFFFFSSATIHIYSIFPLLLSAWLKHRMNQITLYLCLSSFPLSSFPLLFLCPAPYLRSVYIVTIYTRAVTHKRACRYLSICVLCLFTEMPPKQGFAFLLICTTYSITFRRCSTII